MASTLSGDHHRFAYLKNGKNTKVLEKNIDGQVPKENLKKLETTRMTFFFLEW